MHTPTMAVQANNARWFAVRYLPKGARYGRSNTLTADRDTVEFYDLSEADDSNGSALGPLGQFVARYHATTLLGLDEYGDGRDLGETGLCLDGGNPDAWTLDAVAMRRVLAWLYPVWSARQMTDEV